jgi:hypothetical protein
VPSFSHSVVVNELGVRLFGPTAWGGVKLIGEGAYRDRYLDSRGREKRDLARWHVVGRFPIKAGCRHCGVGQPVERDVRGLLNKQVGAELGMAEITVKAHRGQVMRKMNAASLADLVSMAARLGLEKPAQRTR